MLIADDMHDWREGEPPASLPFERRRHLRRPLQGAARAVLLDAAHFGQFRQLALLDYSDGGLGALTSMPINPGTELSVTLGTPNGATERGTVVTCRPCGDGYRVSIRFSLRMAA